MTTIHRLPEEILNNIFKELHPYDLRNCQHVCSAWYSPAHVKFLNHVELDDTCRTVKKFINSIDHNPDPQYLRAVKSITIKYLDCKNVEYGHEDFNKLFFRFPNLEKVYTRDCLKLFKNFDDQVCEALLENCPKINKFEVDTYRKHHVQYCQLLYKLRSLVTVMNINDIDYADAGLGDFLMFITSFPRLNKIRDNTSPFLENFQKLLPVLSRLSNLKSICMGVDKDEDDNAELYLVESNKEKQDILINRLSKLRKLKFYSDYGFSVNSMKFACRYLTGLETLTINIMNLDDSQHEEFCDSLLDLACSTMDKANVYIEKMKLDTLSICFTTILDKVFAQIPLVRAKSVLRLEVQRRNDLSINLNIHRTRFKHNITIGVSHKQNLQEIISALFSENIQLNKVDVFKFGIDGRSRYDDKMSIDTYDAFLQQMTLLKDLTLDIPSSYSDSSITHDGSTCPQVKNVTLRPTPHAKIQSLLDRCCIAFPSLKCMKLQYNCGVWDDDAYKFHINLPAYELERLVVDMTPLKLKMKKYFNRISIKDDFFVIELKCSDGQQLYKVPLDLSSTTKITNVDLVNSKGYFTVDVLVSKLHELGLLMHLDTKDNNEEDNDQDVIDKEENNQEDTNKEDDDYNDYCLYSDTPHINVQL